MRGLNAEKSEAFVRYLVDGLAPRAAALKAGYSNSWARRAVAKARRDDIGRMIAKRQWDDARAAADLAPVISALMQAAADALNLKSAAAFAAARDMYVEAARLKGLPPPPAQPPAPRQPEMTEEEWLAAYAPNPERQP